MKLLVLFAALQCADQPADESACCGAFAHFNVTRYGTNTGAYGCARCFANRRPVLFTFHCTDRSLVDTIGN